jgi:hypothetical protein
MRLNARERYATKERQLEVQRRAKNDRVWPLKHLRRFVELFLKFNVPYDLCRLRHLSYQFLQSSENPNQTAFELIRELRKVRIVNHHFQEERSIVESTLQISVNDAPLHHCTTASISSTLKDEIYSSSSIASFDSLETFAILRAISCITLNGAANSSLSLVVCSLCNPIEYVKTEKEHRTHLLREHETTK